MQQEGAGFSLSSAVIRCFQLESEPGPAALEREADFEQKPQASTFSFFFFFPYKGKIDFLCLHCCFVLFYLARKEFNENFFMSSL